MERDSGIQKGIDGFSHHGAPTTKNEMKRLLGLISLICLRRQASSSIHIHSMKRNIRFSCPLCEVKLVDSPLPVRLVSLGYKEAKFPWKRSVRKKNRESRRKGGLKGTCKHEGGYSVISLSIGGISIFISVLSKVTGFIGVKALSFLLAKMGCSSTLAFMIGCAFRALVTAGIGANTVNPSGGEIVPSNSGSRGPSYSHSRTENSFSIGVLMEPFSETEMEVRSSGAREEAGPSHQGRDEPGPSREIIEHNGSLESSMRNRIARLEQDKNPYLLGKAKGAYWSEIKRALDHAPSQGEYNRLVSFENRDLQLRELKHEALRLFQEVLAQNPPLADQAPYNPQEAFQDFLSEHGDQLDRLHWDVSERDKLELQFLALVKQGLKRDGPSFIRENIL
ncbi:hypothetical protein R6Q59_033309 [Mikania micrantha]